jgi:hypothetical protein
MGSYVTLATYLYLLRLKRVVALMAIKDEEATCACCARFCTKAVVLKPLYS